MKITYISRQNKYVDPAGRPAVVAEYGKDFYNCTHDFQDTGSRGETPGANGKLIKAAVHQCTQCLVFTVVELKK